MWIRRANFAMTSNQTNMSAIGFVCFHKNPASTHIICTKNAKKIITHTNAGGIFLYWVCETKLHFYPIFQGFFYIFFTRQFLSLPSFVNFRELPLHEPRPPRRGCAVSRPPRRPHTQVPAPNWKCRRSFPTQTVWLYERHQPSIRRYPLNFTLDIPVCAKNLSHFEQVFGFYNERSLQRSHWCFLVDHVYRLCACSWLKVLGQPSTSKKYGERHTPYIKKGEWKHSRNLRSR